jgi:hypothetical protein
MKRYLIIIICLVASIQIGGKEALAIYYGDVGSPGTNEIHIGKTAIEMPSGTILLVRKGLDYCAVKFFEFSSDKTNEEFYARYESYYQGDQSGDFNKKNVQLETKDLSASKRYGVGRFSFRFGNSDIRCGHFRLFWFGKGSVFFFSSSQEAGDYGIEIAPTKWSDISEVNVFDPRLKWYRYDENRQRVNIPIDRLWDDNEGDR